MEKLYKLIFFFVGLIAMNLTVHAQHYAYSQSLSNDLLNDNRLSMTNSNAVESSAKLISALNVTVNSNFNQATDFTSYPNPATTSTTIGYTLTKKTNVLLRVIDLAGKQLSILLKREQPAGKQEFYWELAKNNITSGMYILLLQADNKTYSRKIIVQ